jgi:protein-L-isoaspartate(D-aspartate) O-methyltransferase
MSRNRQRSDAQRIVLLIPERDLGIETANAVLSARKAPHRQPQFRKDVMSDFKLERINMVESQIRPNAVTDPDLLKALLETPREVFVPPSLRSLAYMDGVLCVEGARDHRPARYMLSPMVFAKLAQLANIRKTDRVLDVGGTTGYSAAILSKLAASVVALENDAGLTAVAKESLAGLGVENVTFVMGPLEAGAPESAPFDVIFLNGRAGHLPESLLSQLAEGGRLVAVMGSETAAKAKLFLRISGGIQERTGFDAGAPALPGFESRPVFVF